MSKPNTLRIEANFDVEQISPTLECNFIRSDARGEARKGKYAGALLFAPGDEVFVQVNAGGQMRGPTLPFASFRVVDFTITSRPRVFRCGPEMQKTEYAPPSPFEPLAPNEEQGATVVLPASGFKDAPVSGTTPGYYQRGLAWDRNLTVAKVRARWRLTFMVTVEIVYDEHNSEMRVFEIDPESEVETGTGMGEEEMFAVRTACTVDPESEVETGTGRV